MNEGAANVHVVTAPMQHDRNQPIHDNARSRHDHHRPGVHSYGIHHAVSGFEKDVNRHCYQAEGIYERRQHAGAMVAKGLGRSWWTCPEVHRYP